MKAQFLACLEQFEKAAFVHLTLVDVCDPNELSAPLTEAYGSDVIAQCFGQSAGWYSQLEEPEAALEVCCFIEKRSILPTVAISDGENAILIVHPALWILKDNGRATDAKHMFDSYLVNSVGEYGSQGSGSFQPIMEPVQMLLDLAALQWEVLAWMIFAR